MTDTTKSRTADEVAWTVLVAASSVLFSFAFACATPLAALAAVAATRMRRAAGIAAVLLAWAGNQAIGYGLLHYPRTPNSFAWGAAIGAATLLAMAAAMPTSRLRPVAVRAFIALSAAFVTYELTLYAASFVLGASASAFAFPVIARLATINVMAFGGLLLLHRFCLLIGLRLPAPAPQQSLLLMR